MKRWSISYTHKRKAVVKCLLFGLSAHIVKFLFSHQILHFTQWTFAKKFLDLGKKRLFFMNLLRPENSISLLSIRAGDHMIDKLRVVT